TTGNWCNETMHVCVPTVANGTPVPTDGAHTNPTLDGKCTMAAGALTCTSAVCDTKDNECGYANGDGPCDAKSGATVCRSTICATSGPNMRLCEACVMDSQCSGGTPICDTNKNNCVQCTPTAAGACTGTTPVCDMGSDQCVKCNGDFGSG